jgi:predicted outer membrane repeat protein
MSAARAIRRTQERRLQWERRHKAAGAIGATAIGTVILAPGAAADTFTVTNLDNNGPGSFRRAVNLANNNAGLDQVVFQSSLSGAVTLNSSVYIYDGVEIAGPGANQLTLDADGNDRILTLYGLPADNRRVAVSDLTLSGGAALYGGAIYSLDADLEIARSRLTGNTATYGGAIYSSNSSLTLADTQVTDNSADAYGGGIYATDSTINVARSRFTGNYAAGGGGAVYGSNSPLTVADSYLIDNSSDGYGGGIYAAGSTINIARSRITDNDATSTGGAVNTSNSSLTLANTRLSDNNAYYGGGVYAAGSTINIARSRFTGNDATYGGAVYGSNSSLTLADTEVTSNSSEGYGGGVYAAGSRIEIANSEVTYNSAGSSGGGIAAANSPLRMRGTSVNGNESQGYGGGVFLYGDPAVGSAPADIGESSFFGNYARLDGGGAYVGASGAVTIAQTTLSGNDANRSGGGLAVGYGANGSAVTISASTLSGNRAVRRNGGGLSIAGPTGQTLLQNVTISGNVTGRNGGGAYVYNAYDTPVTVRNSTVVNNEAGPPGYGGGGIYQYGGDCVADPDPPNPPRAACAGGRPGDTMVLSSTIVADNEAYADPDLGGGGGGYSYFQAGFNLIGERPYLATMTGDPSGSNIVGEEPNLGPLYDNGGPTYTHEPYGNSPALDAGIANGLTQDQRGSQRTIRLPGVRTARGSDATDIGSVEATACLKAVGKPVSNKLKVRVPFSGVVKLKKTGNVKGQRKEAEEAGKVKLLVKSRGSALKRLNQTGKANVKAKVRFAPDCGRPRTKSKKIRLVKR